MIPALSPNTRRNSRLAACLLTQAWLVLLAPLASASPMDPSPTQVVDADGTPHEILLHGDEFSSWTSDLNGFPVAQGDDGHFRYLKPDSEGIWQLTTWRLGTATKEELQSRGAQAWPDLDPTRLSQAVTLRNTFSGQNRGASKAVVPNKPRGKLRALVIPMGFQDKPMTRSQAELQALFDGPVHDYYLEASGGALNLSATVISPLRMTTGNMRDYAWNTHYPARPAWNMFLAAFNKLNAEGFDFKQFDGNKDGYADLVVVIHAGEGHEQYSYDTTANDNLIHSHFMAFSNVTGLPETYTSHDGIKFFGYVTAPENSKTGDISPLGVVVHEAGHYLGLPDLYQTGNKSSKGQGLGEFCLMSSGMWLGRTSGSSPAHPSAWCKLQLGWTTSETISTSKSGVLLAPIQTSAGKVLRLPTKDNANDPKQYFLLENRTKDGFDTHLPGSGLFIYHVDEGIFPGVDTSSRFQFNQDPNHYAIDFEQADGKRELNTTTSRGDSTDPFPTQTNSDFTPTSTPSSLSYGATSGTLSVTNIRKQGDNILFDIDDRAPLANGQPCTRDAMCSSGICGGTCCDQNCDGLCERVCASQRPNCPFPSGVTCDDGDKCTQNDRCDGMGNCMGDLVRCNDTNDTCILNAFCDPNTGRCFVSPAEDGASCVSSFASEGDEFCMGGKQGTCLNGTCLMPTANNGLPCDDGNMCTTGNTCWNGRCQAGNPVTCPTPDECHLPGTCAPQSGVCSVIPAFEGTPCSKGTCRSGICVAKDGTSSGCTASGASGQSVFSLILFGSSFIALRTARRRRRNS